MKKYSIRDLLILTTIVAMLVNAGLYAHRRLKAPANSPKKSVADLEQINAQLRAELEELKMKLAAEQAERRAIIPRLRATVD
jgi:ribosomal protein L29